MPNAKIMFLESELCSCVLSHMQCACVCMFGLYMHTVYVCIWEMYDGVWVCVYDYIHVYAAAFNPFHFAPQEGNFHLFCISLISVNNSTIYCTHMVGDLN